MLTANVIEEIGKDPNTSAFIPSSLLVRYSVAIGTCRAEKPAVLRIYDITLQEREKVVEQVALELRIPSR